MIDRCVEFLTQHGWMLIGGVTLFLLLGELALSVLQSPIRRLRLTEWTLVGALAWLVLAVIPLPRTLRPEIASPAAPAMTTPATAEGQVSPIQPTSTGGNPPVAGDSLADSISAGSLPETAPPTAGETGTDKESPSPKAPATSSGPSVDVRAWLIRSYLWGAACCAAWLVVCRVILFALVAAGQRPPAWLERHYHELAPESYRRPRLVMSPLCRRPFSCGVVFSTIVLPVSYGDKRLTEPLRQVLRHELAHARQGDGRNRFLLNIAFPVFYCHPLYWRLRWRAIFDAELIADDLAARQTSAETYASDLIRLIRETGRPLAWLPASAGVMASPTEFSRRMKMLMDRSEWLSERSALAWRLGCAATCAVVVALAAGAWGIEPLRDAKADAIPDRAAKPVRPPITETLIPVYAKSFVSIPDLRILRAAWDKTQLGAFTNDPKMKPFMEDLEEQLDRQIAQNNQRLGIDWKDVEDVYGGEICLATFQPPSDPKASSYAMGLLVDITGKRQQADQLLAKVKEQMQVRRAVRGVKQIGDVQLVVYTLPRKPGRRARQALHFIHGDWMVATDHLQVATDIIDLVTKGGKTKPFSGSAPFQKVLKRTTLESRGAPQHVRWFIEPLGLAEVTRAAKGARKNKSDRIKVLRDTGFDKLTGVGGLVAFDHRDRDVEYYVFIVGSQDDLQQTPSAKLLDFPNEPNLLPPKWVPQDASSVTVFNLKMMKAFKATEAIANGFAGDDIWKDVIESIKIDPNGPMVDVFKVVEQLKDRAVIISDVRTPIEVDSERMLIAIELRDPAVVAKLARKAFARDPDAQLFQHNEHEIWEIVDPKKRKMKKRGIAVTVAHNHLIIGKHVKFLRKVIDQTAHGRFVASPDFQAVQSELTKLGAGVDSFRTFLRSDRTLHTDYELIRANKMAEAQTVFGNMLNRIWSTGDEAVARKQKLDGNKLPPFDQVRKYFRPGGLFIRSEPDGWIVKGMLLP